LQLGFTQTCDIFGLLSYVSILKRIELSVVYLARLYIILASLSRGWGAVLGVFSEFFTQIERTFEDFRIDIPAQLC
jgi:hypothetical protein